MKIATLIVALMTGLTSLGLSQDLPLYRIYRAQGEVSDFTQMADELLMAQVILFGELHNNAVNHYLQLQLSKRLLQNDPELLFGAEMFESDNQLLIDEYLSGAITAQQLEAEGKMWNNFKTDYKPLLDLAKENKRPFIATNVPRRYASMVNRGGLESLDALPDQAKAFIAPLPIAVDLDLPGYKWMIETMGAHAPGGQSSNIAKAQAIKDATMAHFILENLSMDTRLLHFHGTFHSNNFEGIYWYLKQANLDMAIMTIATVEQDNLQALEEANKGLADFIIVIPRDAPKSY